MQTATPAARAAFLADTSEPPITSDYLARLDGWDDAASMRRVRLQIIAAASRIVTNRAAVGDPCLDWTDVEDGLIDRYEARALPIPDAVRSWNARAMLTAVAHRVWENVRDAQEAEAWAARLLERVRAERGGAGARVAA